MVWNITIVDDSMIKQFSKEKGDKMSALPATVGGLTVDIPVGTVRRALAIAELSGSFSFDHHQHGTAGGLDPDSHGFGGATAG